MDKKYEDLINYYRALYIAKLNNKKSNYYWEYYYSNLFHKVEDFNNEEVKKNKSKNG